MRKSGLPWSSRGTSTGGDAGVRRYPPGSRQLLVRFPGRQSSPRQLFSCSRTPPHSSPLQCGFGPCEPSARETKNTHGQCTSFNKLWSSFDWFVWGLVCKDQHLAFCKGNKKTRTVSELHLTSFGIVLIGLFGI
ncbi:hypothetical protein AVEN_194767-1 [Araneus ventricosus]|uniref:Uncharacterized protein n=1 Tax=Araneus ventricosus TaxID=182803 RepID=A0A4Y2B4W5_ARAVE|nr:hypothetical protein AVEN_194767-1 [Araneus ventricosus]